MPASVINDLTLMATKGIVTKGVMTYINQECYNQELLTKLENQIYQILCKMEDTINTEIQSSLEHITKLL